VIGGNLDDVYVENLVKYSFTGINSI